MNQLSRNSRYFIGIVGLGIIIMLVVSFNNRITEMRNLSDQAEQINQEVQELELTQLALETQIGYASSDTAVEEWAYEDARWIREGDVPIAPIAPTDSTPVPLTIEIPNQTTVQNWQIWRALFFEPISP